MRHLAKYWCYSWGEITGGIICVCVPVMPRAFAELESKLSSFIVARRSFRAERSGEFEVNVLTTSGAKKNPSLDDLPCNYLELKGHCDGKIDRAVFQSLEGDRNHSEPELKVTQSIV